MAKQPEMMFWLDDHRGVYIPRDFALSFKDRAKHVSGVDADTWAILENPEHEWYWEAWEDVCRDAIVTDDDGNQFRVYQDGACWLVPVGMEWDENNETFDWPKEDADYDPDY